MKQIKPLLISALVGIICTGAVITSIASWGLDQILKAEGISLDSLVIVVKDYKQLSSEVGQFDVAITDLESKHGGGYIVGLKYFYNCDCHKYRTVGTGNEPKYYPAYKSKSTIRYGKWVYLKEGLEYLIHN